MAEEKLLILSCCAPCSCGVIQKLAAQGRKFTVLFYNPNIDGETEYQKRLAENKRVCARFGVPFAQLPYEPQVWRQAVKGLEGEPERGKRCSVCFELRLRRAARYAKEHGFDAFTSTLFVSPYQNHQMMKDVAEKISRAVDIPFYYEDFRPGYERGVDISLELELYRQPYCGCIFSEEERYSNSFKKKRRKKLKALHENQSVNKGNDNNEQSS